LILKITQATYEALILASGASFDPTLEPTDICHNCVEGTFLGGFIKLISRLWIEVIGDVPSREIIPI
jgi:hypothetical protein